jgi:hypothetical protein
MGRVVSADRLVIGSNPRQRLVVLAAARSVGVSEGEMQRRIQVRGHDLNWQWCYCISK